MAPRSKQPKWRNQMSKQITMVDPRKLVANPLNAREHPAGQIGALGEILDELGWLAPCIVNEATGRMIDGHARVEKAISENETVVPVIYVQLDEAQERKALAVFDAVGSMATYNAEVLTELLSSIESGVGQGFLDSMLADLGDQWIGALDAPAGADGVIKDLGTHDDDSVFWPTISVKVAPNIKKDWDALWLQVHGDEDLQPSQVMGRIIEAAKASTSI